MGLTQRFQLYQAPGAFGPETVCAGCQAPMIMAEAEAGLAGELAMTHAEDCEQVKTEPAGQR